MLPRGEGGPDAGLRRLSFSFANWGNRIAASIFLLLVNATCALAEVCDKTVGVNETWTREDGPVFRFLPFGPVACLVVFVGVVSLFAVTRMRKASVVASGILITYGVLLILGSDNETRPSALVEGCLSNFNDFVTLAFYFGGGMVFGLLAIMLGRHEPRNA